MLSLSSPSFCFPEGASKCQGSLGCRGQGSGVRQEAHCVTICRLHVLCHCGVPPVSGRQFIPCCLQVVLGSTSSRCHSSAILEHMGDILLCPTSWATGSSASGCCQYVGSLMLLCCSTTSGTCEHIMAHLSCYLPQGTALLSQHTGMGSPEVWATFLLEAQADIEVLLPPWVQSKDRMVGPLCSLPPLSYPCPPPAQGVLIQDTG